MLITENPTEAYNLLLSSLRKIILNRLNDKAFIDPEDALNRAYFSTCEGLDALLIPIVNLPANLIWTRLKNEFPKLESVIDDDISFILRYYSSTCETPCNDHGIPYFRTKRGTRFTPYWTSECSSFTLSVLINYYHFKTKFDIPIDQTIKKKILKAIDINIEWIKTCKRDNGWSWTPDSPIHYWPTWSILDTFEELLNSEFLSKYFPEITNDCKNIVEKTTESFRSDITSSYGNEWQVNVVESQPYDVQSVLDLSRLILAISLHSNEKATKPLAFKLFDWCKSCEIKEINYCYYLNVRKDPIPDSSLVPCLLRTLIILANSLRPRSIEELDTHLGQNHKLVINRFYSLLKKSLITHGKYSDLWGVLNGGLNYELYFTERSIEALTELILYYNEDDKIKIEIVENPALSINSNHSEIITSYPEAELILSDITPPNLPILEECTRQLIESCGNDIFNNITLVFVLHYLKDLIPFIDKFIELGAKYNNMYFLVKTYDYPDKEKVISYFKSTGANVFLPEDQYESTFTELAHQVLSDCIEKGDGNKILIIEDGGYFVPLSHQEKFVDKTDLIIGAVEQTTKGHRKDELVKDLQYPVISVAKSKIKSTLEGREVAETLQENVVYLAKNILNKPLEKLKVLILGYGTIGKELARAVANKNMKVFVYDPDPLRRMAGSMESYLQVLENLENIDHIDLIIGVSGTSSLDSSNNFWHLKHNVYLISGSSERIEFNLNTLEKISASIQRQGIITKYELKKDSKIINLFCEGEPINFQLSGGINDAIIDPIYSEMLLSAIELMTNSALKNELLDVPNEIETKIVEIYKNYYKS